jgi:hypothetical protein
MVEVPAGKRVKVAMNDPVSSKTSQPGQPVAVTVTKDTHTKEHPGTVIPAGTIIRGTVTQVQSAKQFSGQALLGFQFDRMDLPSGESLAIAASIASEGEDTKKRTQKGVAGGAVAGAIAGGLIGKDAKGALIGAAAGAAIGTGVVASMDNKDVELAPGAPLEIQINQAVQVPVPRP